MKTLMGLRAAIDRGDVVALQSLLAEDPARANTMIHWGRADANICHPLHYVCDKVFDGTLSSGNELTLVRALIESGSDVNFREGDPLAAAASLGAIEVAFTLLDAGARPDYKWNTAPVPGDRGGHREAVLHLARAGALAEPEWLKMEKVSGDPEVLAVLRGIPSQPGG